MSKKSKTWYRQCRYEQVYPNEQGGRSWDVSWIPESLAKVGQVIYFGEKRDEVAKEDLYRVILVGDNRRSHAEASKREQDHKHQRKASDV